MSLPMSPPVICMRDLQCSAQGRLLLHIDHLQVGAGERVAVVGHNGAGKSTLLKLLSGLMPHQHGELCVLGVTLHPGMSRQALRALRCRVGHMWQGLHLVGRLSAEDNTMMGALGRLSGWRSWVRAYPAHEQALAREALARVGALGLAATRCDRLSGGERQKVAMARLLMQSPALILADEPTAALDPAAAAEACKLLVQAAQGATLITVVHNPALLPLLCERVVGLRHGQVVFDLPQHQVCEATLQRLYQG
jgi:phosphonate transport system ATP-binding protein